MESEIRQSIIKTVLYADIFDYPLTAAQIWKYLVISRKIKRKDFDKVLESIQNPIAEKGGWYFMSGREELAKKRLKRERESRKKLSKAFETAIILSRIPTITLIGVSGGVAMLNGDKHDDIDLFIIARKNAIWQTRFFSVLALKLLRRYRKRSEKKVANKICLNMLVDEQGLVFPEDRRDFYTAHEITQMKPVFSRGKTYEKFISANHWVEEFLPNAIIKQSIKIRHKKNNLPLFLIEFFAKMLQLWYIKRHLSRETVRDEMLAFHPIDYKEKIMKKYSLRLKKYGQKI